MAKATAKKVKSIVLFDNYNGYDFEEFKKELIADNDGDVSQVSDQEVWDCISESQNEDYDNAKWDLKEMFGDDEKVIVCGSLGTWQGNRDAMRICDNVEDALYQCTKDCDYIKIEVEGRKVKVKSSHHDGTNNFEIKKVTDKGKRLYDSWNTRFEHLLKFAILKKIWENGTYSRLPKKVW